MTEAEPFIFQLPMTRFLSINRLLAMKQRVTILSATFREVKPRQCVRQAEL
jgi:hypothetical protein